MLFEKSVTHWFYWLSRLKREAVFFKNLYPLNVSEYYYGRTLGMLAVGTRILGFDGGHVPYSAVRRRLVARFSMVWGVVGWLTLFTHFRIAEGYIILRKGETIEDLKIENDES